MGVRRVKIPGRFSEIFEREIVIIIDPVPGLMPIDIRLLAQAGMMDKLASDETFMKEFEFIAVPKEILNR